MMRKEAVYICLVFVFMSYASAMINVTIQAEDSYDIGENASFNYSILSDTDIIVRSIAIVNCVGGSYFWPEIKLDYEIKAGTSFSATYNKYINDSLTSQTCNATVYIIAPQKITTVQSIGLVGNDPVDDLGGGDPGNNSGGGTNDLDDGDDDSSDTDGEDSSEEDQESNSEEGGLDNQLAIIQGKPNIYFIFLASVSSAILILGAIVVILFLKIIKKN